MSAAAGTTSMPLTPQDFTQVLAALKAMNDAAGHERRVSPRMEIQVQVRIFPYDDGSLGRPYTALTRDLSFRGVGLLQSCPAAQGWRFVIVLPKAGTPLSVLCTVLRCRPIADGMYMIGAAFDDVFDFDKSPPPLTTRAVTANDDAELDRIRNSILG
jgi:hypothetical protein